MLRWLEATEYPGQRNAVTIARREGRLVAYCFVTTDDEDLVVSEVAYEEAQAVGPLLRAVVEGAGEPAPQRLVAFLPWENAALRLIDATGRSVPNSPTGWMWRINDLSSLLEQLHPVLEERLASLPAAAEGARLLLASERAGVALEVDRGRLRIDSPEGAPGSTGLLRCCLSQADLVTLILGCYPSAGWLEERGLPGAAQPWLASLFPPSRGVFWQTDNF
jgi:hypothetical protein